MSHIKTKKKDQKESLPQSLTYSSIFWLGVMLFVAMPFVNNFLLQVVQINISGNIAYKSFASTVSIICEILSVLTAYAGLGVLAAAVANFGAKRAKGTVILAMLYHTVSFVAYMMAYAFSGARNYAIAMFMLGMDALANTLIYAVILAVLIMIRRKRQKNEADDSAEPENKLIARGGIYTYVIAAVGIFGAAKLAATLYSMLSAFIDPSLGTPVNMQEWVYWISEYLTLFIYVGIGYVMSLSIFFLCKTLRKRFEKEEAK